MITLRKSDDRGQANHGWLDSKFTFSFAGYQDPRHMAFRNLRVINEDRISPGGGFPMHSHRDMEIFSYVLEGELSHADSMGNTRVLRPGQIQLMSAGQGVRHSEFNPSRTEETHMLQMWIFPREQGLKPSYTEWHPKTDHAQQGKVLVISSDGREDSAVIHQDAFVYRIKLKAGEVVSHEVHPERGAWMQLATGSLSVNTTRMIAGDGAHTETAGLFEIRADQDAEGILFDLG